MAGNGADQQRAELRGESMLAGRAGPRCQPFQRHGGVRTQFQQVLGVFAHHVEVFFRHADQNQVGERLFGIGMTFEDLLIDLRGLVGMTQGLQRNGLAELRLFVCGIQFQAAIEAEKGGFGIFLTEVADTETEVRIHVAGIERAGAMEGLGGVLPHAGALQADSQVEPAHGVLRLHLGQDTVAFCGLFEVAKFELNVAHGAVDLGRGFVRGDGAL